MKLKVFLYFYLAYLVWYATMIIRQKYTVKFQTKRYK